MSAGCVHQKASVALGVGFLLGSLAFGPGTEYATGALIGILLTPDLDVDGGYIGNTLIRNRMGRVFEVAWNVLWFPYRKSLKHGSPLSHWPIISTLFRIGYLFLLLIILPYVIFSIVAPGAWNIGMEIHWWLALSAHYYRIILGLIGSDVIHWTLDVLTTEHAKQKQKIMVFGMPLASSMCK